MIGRAWPRTVRELEEAQRALAAAAARAAPWRPADLAAVRVAAVFATYPTGRPGPGEAGEPAWAGAALVRAGAPHEVLAEAAVRGETGAPYVAGLLALRCGALLERAVGALEERPDLLLVDATARDHPRRAGLALHLGAVLDLPSLGVTNRPLLAACEEPGAGARRVGPPRRSTARRSAAACARGRGRTRSSCTPAGGSTSRPLAPSS